MPCNTDTPYYHNECTLRYKNSAVSSLILLNESGHNDATETKTSMSVLIKQRSFKQTGAFMPFSYLIYGSGGILLLTLLAYLISRRKKN